MRQGKVRGGRSRKLAISDAMYQCCDFKSHRGRTNILSAHSSTVGIFRRMCVWVSVLKINCSTTLTINMKDPTVTVKCRASIILWVTLNCV